MEKSMKKSLQELMAEASVGSPLRKMSRQQAAVNVVNQLKKGVPTNIATKGVFKKGHDTWNKGISGKNSWAKTRKERGEILKATDPEAHKKYFGTIEQHSEKTKKQMGESATKRWANHNRPKVIADGVEYTNFLVCAEKLGIHKDSVTYRCKSKSATWQGWYFVQQGEQSDN